MATNLFQVVVLLSQIVISLQTGSSNCESTTCLPSSCADIRMSGNARSGIYNVYPKRWFDKSNITVYCDMETDGGGWTVFQRRDNYETQQSFIQNWNAYRKGFGKLDKDFWLGNDNIHILTNQEYVSLRIDLEDFSATKHFVVYNLFSISGCHDRYRLRVEKFSGTTIDSMTYHNDATFVTFDDGDLNKCSDKHKGGWWYKNCHHSNLNGIYLEGNGGITAISWNGFGTTSLKKVEMKIRPTYFSLQDN